MSASLVGSEMCIRDRFSVPRLSSPLPLFSSRPPRPAQNSAGNRTRGSSSGGYRGPATEGNNNFQLFPAAPSSFQQLPA
eukprot:5726248-Alexandrium_andersonii.AAC.1